MRIYLFIKFIDYPVYEKPFLLRIDTCCGRICSFSLCLDWNPLCNVSVIATLFTQTFFVFEGKIEDGNSVRHTTFKLGEFLIGMLVASALSRKRYKIE